MSHFDLGWTIKWTILHSLVFYVWMVYLIKGSIAGFGFNEILAAGLFITVCANVIRVLFSGKRFLFRWFLYWIAVHSLAVWISMLIVGWLGIYDIIYISLVTGFIITIVSTIFWTLRFHGIAAFFVVILIMGGLFVLTSPDKDSLKPLMKVGELGQRSVRVLNDMGVNISRCSDGTWNNFCSGSKPLFCRNSTLVNLSSRCGCPYDYKPKGEGCVKILRCSDGTAYGDCSSDKPKYCSDGRLVDKSSVCGCSYDEVSEKDVCINRFQTGPRSLHISYGAGRIDYVVYGGLNDYLAGLSREIWTSSGEPSPTDRDFILKALDNSDQKRMLDPLIDELRKTSKNDEDQAINAIRLVQAIPYDYAAFSSGVITGKYPYEVLYTQKGVCSEKVQLLAYLLRGLDYSVAVLRFNEESHDAIGIKCPPKYQYKSTGYCFVEATRPTAIAKSDMEYVGVGRLTSEPEVIVIHEGKSFGSISFRSRQEYGP